MNLYRLDYVAGRPVKDRILGRDVLCRRYSDACQRARAAAEAETRAVLVTRIGRAGWLTPLVHVLPDGRRERVGR